jgi:hypothetical protein
VIAASTLYTVLSMVVSVHAREYGAVLSVTTGSGDPTGLTGVMVKTT